MRHSRLLSCLLALASVSVAQAAPEKIIFDTDSAFFNDDGAALALMLQRPDKADILGVTVVSGNEWSLQGAEYMLHVLEMMGRSDIPLYLGADLPLINTPERAKVIKELWGERYDGAFSKKHPLSAAETEPPFGGKFAAERPQPASAVRFIIDTVEKNPGQITILALGPMTNIALALRERPGLDKKIKRLVFQGGTAFVNGNSTPSADFNQWFDPEASHIVLRSEIPEKIMFPLDLSNQAVMTRGLFDQIVAKKTPMTELYAEDMGNRYPGFYKNPKITGFVWDCLDALWLIDPGIVKRSQTVWADVDVNFGPSYGRTNSHPVKRGELPRPVTTMLDLDFDRFFALYKGLLTSPIRKMTAQKETP